MSLRWFGANASRFSGVILEGEPLARHTYYRIGGPASLLLQPRSAQDLVWISEGLRESRLPYFVLGAGSNLLVSDSGFQGVVIKTTKLDIGIEALGSEVIRTGASVAISSLLRRAGQEGWSGFERLTGIPGSVGGAIAMNAGTHLGEVRDLVVQVQAFDLESGQNLDFTGSELRFEYRRNLFLPPSALVTSVQWRRLPSDPGQVQALIQETLARRKASQPIDFPSCGSVFKNPRDRGLHAWQVIENVGLRGYRQGDAEFSAKHCNFIVNHGSAKAADVKALIDEAKRRARDQLGIELEEEVRYLG